MEKVVFNYEKCKGCELCTTVCPVGIIVMNPDYVNSQGFHPADVIEQEKCISCGNCARRCPDVAIAIYRYKQDKKEEVS